jgi:curved DNA-binding protein CbpA
MQMPLAEPIKLLGVRKDYTYDDVIAASRRAARRCHPDHGGTEAQFIELVKARDRLLATLGA